MKKLILLLALPLGILFSSAKDDATDPVVTTISFSTDVVPVIAQCDACHTHRWTKSPVAATFYANLVSQGYVNPTAYQSSKIFKKMSGGHPSRMTAAVKANITNWMIQGSLNN